MNAFKLVSDLRQRGIQLQADGGDLTVRAPRGALTPALRAQLTSHRDEVLSLLENTRAGGGAPGSGLARALRHEPFPLTDIQQAYWVGRTAEFAHGEVSIHFYAEIDSGAVDVARLESAFRVCIQRHDALRTVVSDEGDQRILEGVEDYAIRVDDLRAHTAESAEQRLAATRDALRQQVFPNGTWPAFEVRVSLLPEQRARLHLSFDLMCLDGGSLLMLFDEWARLYEDPCTSFAPLEFSFREYALAERAQRRDPAYERAVKYWKMRAKELPAAPALPMAATNAATSLFTHRTRVLEHELWQALEQRALSRNITAANVLLAAYAELLRSYSGSDELTINLTLFNRLPFHRQVDQILGDFTSMILLGTNGSEHATFAARASALQEQLWRDLDHHEVSGVEVMREFRRNQTDPARAIMPFVFTNMLNLGKKGFVPLYASLGKLGTVGLTTTQTPQVWFDYQLQPDPAGVRLMWDVRERLFPPGIVDAMFEAYCELVQALATDDAAWDDPRLSVLPQAQLAVRDAVNATAEDVPALLLHQPFCAQAERQPEHLAVVSGDVRLTYRQLQMRAAALGARLREQGAKPNTLVAIVMEKGWEQVVAMFAVQMSGAAYVPIDPASPASRLSYLLEHAQADIALTVPALDEALSWPARVTRIAVTEDDHSTLDDAARAAFLRAPVQTPADLAYVIYTSGSTGLPKGVMIEHRGAVNRILDVNKRAGVGPADSVLALTALQHDMSVYDVFGVLGAGGTLVMPHPALLREPDHWAQLIESERVTVWNTVPAFLDMLIEVLEHAPEPPNLTSLRFALLSGDWIPVGLPDRLRKISPQIAILGAGGATETSIWDIAFPIGAVDPAWSSIPYGRPMSNARYYVVDAQLRACPDWVPGQLFSAGVGLARGYWRDAERTAEAFIEHPQTGERLYRTGDMGRYLPDGTIEFLGRRDNQVKIGGTRIELGEIESVLATHPGVRACVVVARGEPGRSRRLVAYVVPEPHASAAAPALIPGHDAMLEFGLSQPGLRKDLGEQLSIRIPDAVDESELWSRLATRRTQRRFATQPIALLALSGLLRCLREQLVDGVPRRLYPSAGGLYPVRTYVYVKPGSVDGLSGGAYYYDPSQHSLIALASDLQLSSEVYSAENRAVFDSAAFSLFLVGKLDAITPMYGDSARDYCLLEAGYMSQLLGQVAPEHAIGLCAIGGLHFEALRAPLRLAADEVLLHSHLGGHFEPTTSSVSPPSLRTFLAQQLPAALVPGSIECIDQLPLTSNGKIDRAQLALGKPEAVAPTRSLDAAHDSLEAKITGHVCAALEIDECSVDRNFFDLGCTSFNLVRLATRLRAELDQHIPVTDLFNYPTIASLSAHLQARAPDNSAQREAMERARARRSASAPRTTQRFKS